MNVFFLDLWQDLRAKRLWPVAGALVIALVAIPVLLLKHSSADPGPAPPAAVAAQADPTRAAVALEDQADEAASQLNAFSPKDPFKSHFKKSADASVASASAAKGAPGAASSVTSPSQDPPPSGNGPGGPGSAIQGGGITPPTGGGTTKPPADTNKKDKSKGDQKTGTQLFTYAVKLRFGAAKKVKTFKDVQRLDLLPSSANPIAVFLGVSASGNTAVFLVQAGFKVQGEGQCRPSIGRCSFLYLRADPKRDAARLTAPDGTSYGLRLTGIEQVDVKSAATSTRAAAARAAKIRKARKHAGRKANPTQPRFLAPIFGDVGS